MELLITSLNKNTVSAAVFARLLSIFDPGRADVVEELSKNIGLEGCREVVQEGGGEEAAFPLIISKYSIGEAAGVTQSWRQQITQVEEHFYQNLAFP